MSPHLSGANDSRLATYGAVPDGTHPRLELTADERAAGYVRPLLTTYRHLVCGTVTTIDAAIAGQLAREPGSYGLAYCQGCQRHAPTCEFVWPDDVSLDPSCWSPSVREAIHGAIRARLGRETRP